MERLYVVSFAADQHAIFSRLRTALWVWLTATWAVLRGWERNNASAYRIPRLRVQD